jgi:tyrosine-protein kinase Etk/Wzc
MSDASDTSGTNGRHNGAVNGSASAPAPAAANAAAAAPGAEANKADASTAAIDLATLWKAVRERWWVAALTALVVTGGVTAYTLQMEPVYRAGSTVAVDAQQETSSSSSAASAISLIGERSLAREIGLLQRSGELARRVVKRLKAAAEAMGTDEHFPFLKRTRGESIHQQARRLMERVQFQEHPQQRMISISVESTVPEEASSIANFYATEYKQFTREKSRESVASARRFLEKQVAKRRDSLRKLEDRWERFASDKKVLMQGESGEQVVSEYNALQKQQTQVQFELRQKQAALSLLEQQLDQAQPGLERQITQERAASELQREVKALDGKLASLKAEAETYYAVDSTRRRRETGIEELETIKSRIAHFKERRQKLTDRLVDQTLEVSDQNAEGEEGGPLAYVSLLKRKIKEKQLAVQELEAQAKALEERLATYQGTLQRLPNQNTEQRQLTRKITQAEQWYTAFVEKLQRTQVAEESELGYVDVIDEAVVPRVPVRPDTAQNIILGLLLGLGFGLALAFVQHATDRRLNEPADLKEHGFALVGTVPDMAPVIEEDFGGRETVETEDGQAVSTSLVTLLAQWSPLVENFRLIRTNVLAAPRDGRSVQTLLVTSPEQGDGKSVSVANLAVVLARSGQRTLLLDADLRRPTQHRLLGVDRSPGLGDLLLQNRSFDPDDFATYVEGLSVVPAGTSNLPPSELLGAHAMRQLVEQATDTYDTIVVDSPPLMAVTDPLVLAAHCDAALTVVSAGRTDASTLRATHEKLAPVGVPVLGTVLNRFDAKRAQRGGYGYGYGYGEEGYYEPRQTKDAPHERTDLYRP